MTCEAATFTAAVARVLSSKVWPLGATAIDCMLSTRFVLHIVSVIQQRWSFRASQNQSEWLFFDEC